MTEGSWTPSPITERKTVRIRRRRTLGAVGLSAAVVGVPVGCLLAPATQMTLLLRTAFWAMAVAVVASLVLWRLENKGGRRRELSEPDLILRGEFGAGGWLVDVLILQGAAPTGADRGMMWIEGGRLYFVGHRTSFGLCPGQAAGHVLWRDPVPGFRLDLSLPLAHGTAAGALTLTFAPVAPQAVAQLREAIIEWSYGRRGQNGQYPPTELGPDAARPTALLLSAMGTSLYWIGGLALAFGRFHGEATAAFVAVLWILSRPYGLWNPWLRWRAWFDRRRIAR